MNIRKQKSLWPLLALAFFLLIQAAIGTLPVFAAYDLSNSQPIKVDGDGYEDWRLNHKGYHSSWVSPGSGFEVPASYANIIQSTGDVTYSAFGKTSKVTEALKAYDKDHPNAERSDPTDDGYFSFDIKENSRGGFGMWAKNLRIYDNEKREHVRLDCKVTVTDWEDETAHTPNAHHVLIQKFARPNINASGLKEVTLKWEYFLAGTDTRYKIKSNVTFDDIDATQYVGFQSEQVLRQFAGRLTRLHYKNEDGLNIYHNPDEKNYEAGDPRNAFGAVYHTDTLKFTYGTENQGTWAHFGYLAYAMFRPTPNDPTKTVSDKDEKDAGEALLSNEGETFTYKVRQVIAMGYAEATFFNSFVMEDTLNECLRVVSAKVQRGSEDCDDFNVSVSGTKVTATAKSTALENEGFYNKTYTLVIKAKLNEGVTDEQLRPYLDGDVARVPNQATVTIDDDPRVTREVGVLVWRPEPTKRVSDNDETKVVSNVIPSRLEAFTYDVQQTVPSQVKNLSKFGFIDQVEECLEVRDVSILEGDTDVTGSWSIDTSGNQVTAFAKNTGNDLAGKSYAMRIVARVKNVPDETLRNHGHYSADKSILNFKNGARLVYRIGDVESDNGADTNQVDTTVRLPVDIGVTKDVDRYEHQVGDPINYTVRVSHGTDDCDASDVVVQDTDLEDFDLDLAKAKVTGVTDHTLESVPGGWKFTTPKLEKGQTATIEFEARAKKVLNGTIVPNVATVKCFAVPEKSDNEEIYINSPKMEVRKKTERSGYAVGETVDYALELTQINEGCFMRDVSLTDLIKTDGVKLLPGSLIVMDKTGKDVTKDINVTFNGNKGFTIKTGQNFAGPSGTVSPTIKGVAPYQDLAFNTYLKIEYSAKLASDDLAGMNVENAAVSPATENTNGEAIKDDPDIPSGGGEDQAILPVRGAELRVQKTSDKNTYEVGDTGKYTVAVEQIRPDYTAKNVVVKDQFQLTGMKIAAGSLKVKHGRTDITDSCAIEATENGYVVETNRDLAYNETLTVTYQVLFESERLRNQEIVNVAVSSADNAKEVETDETVVVGDWQAGLDLEKASDRQEYEVGDTVRYTLKATNIKDDPAREVTIQDEIAQSGIEINPDSIRVIYRSGSEEKDITDSCGISADKTHFEIQTNHGLAKDKWMLVEYEAVIMDKSLAGQQVDNLAVVDASNAEPVEAPHQVDVLPLTKLAIEKSTDKESYRIFEDVHYTLTVTNVGERTARNVFIEDEILTNGIVLRPDTITLSGPDGADITKECEIQTEGSHFSISTGRNLEKGEKMGVTYSANIEDKSLAGKSVDNVAIASADNADEDETTEQAPVEPLAILDLVKTANRETYTILDNPSYTLRVASVGESTARQVVIEDTIQTKGVGLLPESIKVMDSEGADITEDCEIKTNDAHFEIQTGKDLVRGDYVTVTYAVKIVDRSLAGKKIDNLAVASAENADPEDEKESVPVEALALLKLTKNADKKNSQAGDEIRYVLNVKNVSKVTALRVVIKDTMRTKGVTLDKDSIQVKAGKEDVTRDCDIKANRNSFHIQTNHDLAAGKTMTVTYKAKASKNLKGKKIVNVAVAKADNTPKASDKNSLPSKLGQAKNTVAVGSGGKAGKSGKTGHSPQTGDDFPIIVLSLMLICAAATMVAFLRRKAKEKAGDGERLD